LELKLIQDSGIRRLVELGLKAKSNEDVSHLRL
jgi:hypothetical protein